jgi:nicotinate-nucleotide pyrophosphorylase (carboxylating)
MGSPGDDVTSRLTLSSQAVGRATLVQKAPGVVCGLPLAPLVCRAYDEQLVVEPMPGQTIETVEGCFSESVPLQLLQLRGPMRSLLSAERVLLNFLQHLSGVATLTHQFVQQTSGTAAKILDTRKTLPGYRALEKYAVRCGGGHNHRMGLYDGLLIKDNHLADIALADLPARLGKIVNQSRNEDPSRLVEIEVDTLEQLGQVLKLSGALVVLLDNMDCLRMEQAVAMRDAAGKRGAIELEASGGVTLKTVRSIALTGVDRISIGAITHSAPALDIGLDVAV